MNTPLRGLDDRVRTPCEAALDVAVAALIEMRDTLPAQNVRVKALMTIEKIRKIHPEAIQ